MTPEAHQELVLRLCSQQYHEVDPRVFHYILNSVVNKTNDLDLLKKAIFYGKELAFHPDVRLLKTEVNPLNLHPDLAHAIIGLATEAGEMLDRLISMATRTQPDAMDTLNLVEEAGDLFWYFNLLLYHLQADLPSVLDANARKLIKRYPEKAFTSTHALDRNIEAEIEALKET